MVLKSQHETWKHIKAYESSHGIEMVEKFGAHYYGRHGMGPFPSVTSILSAYGGAGGLVQWAVNLALGEARKKIVLARGGDGAINIQEETVDSIFEAAKSAADRARDEAADFGTHVHAAIENLVPGDTKNDVDLTEEEQKHYQVAVDHIEDHNLDPIAAELPVFCEPFKREVPGFGGTVDMICLDKEGDIHILDWKTSKSKSNTHQWQLAAYAYALEQELKKPVKSATVVYTRLNKAVEANLSEGYEIFKTIADAWDATHKKVSLYE